MQAVLPFFMRNCRLCSQSFESSADDLEFYDKISPVFEGRKYLIPPPSLCPQCRAIRRMSWRNERKLYQRQCDLCSKEIISMYRADVKFPVYCSDCWWSDKWDPYEMSRKALANYDDGFDFSHSFFEQFMELHNVLPHFDRAVLQSTMENSDYCNHAGYLKNCYLIFNSDESEQCLYGKGMNRCFNCLDSYKIYDCNSCYEALNCTNLNSCTYIIDSHNSNDCHFAANLMGCNNCFFSVNLRNKSYYIFNEQVPKEEYEKRVAELKRGKTSEQLWQEFKEFRARHFVKWMQEKQTEDCSGDYLTQCKNCQECYDCEYLENSKYCNDLKKGDKISFENHDISYFGMGVDRSYECSVAGYNANHIAFCENVWQGYDIFYSQLCMNGSHDLFGCFGLKKGKYSILNKQYSKEEYEKLVPKIIEHMSGGGELTNNQWGEFFPTELSPLAYNECTAFEYFPLSREDVLARGWNWHDEKEPDYSHITKKIEANKAPQDISKIPDEVLHWALICAESGRLFQIKKQELAFYRKMNLSLPLYHPDVRHEHRAAMKNPRHLTKMHCAKCGKEILSAQSKEDNIRSEVYCNECYLVAIY